MFGLIFRIFPIVFIIVLGLIVFRAVRGVGEWSRNNRSPELSVRTRVVSKRTEVSHHHHNTNDSFHSHSDTAYYATFEVESGDRMELKISGREFGMLAEGDIGKLTFQGTRYLGFERE
ncbi:DUF2500 domain-containing protein [Cohnella sp. CBP 2801]|uniref:DUF2500 domain-containing protein n=2 Tax=Cohnella zeiphila TaxID=2761120 RepID=A0A7X0SMW2_9BACL|nr:DUF2500 domain-containing protein [Cohnella zeiphila]